MKTSVNTGVITQPNVTLTHFDLLKNARFKVEMQIFCMSACDHAFKGATRQLTAANSCFYWLVVSVRRL